MSPRIEAIPDRQTVTPAGEPVRALIAGVAYRPSVTHVDDRGELCEVYDPRWAVSEEPVAYVYQAMVRPGMTKGWVVHDLQDDRLWVNLGFLKIVLYDARENSPTRGTVNELFVSERNRALIVVPRCVFHAVQNVGQVDAYYMNMPTRPYDHERPDKRRLPLDTDKIPYRLDRRAGG